MEITPARGAQFTQEQQPRSGQTGVSPLASLRARLSLIIVLALIPAALFLAYDVVVIRQQVRTDAQADLLRLSQLAAASYGQQLDEANRLLAAIALFPEVQNGNAADCSARLAQMVKLYQPQYQGFAVVDLDGKMFCTSRPISPIVQIADRLWFREAVRTGDFAIGEFSIGRPSGIPVLGLGYPVRDQSSRVVRVVAHGLALRDFQAQADNLPLPADAVLTITDRNGVILARVPDGEKWMGRRQTDADLQQMYRQHEGEVEATGVDGVERLYAFTPILGPNEAEVWLSVGRTPQAIYAGVARTVTRDMLGIGAILLVALAAVWVGSDRLLLRKIHQLVGTSTQLAAGDWQARAPVRADGDELDHLGLTFNQMADALLQRQTEQQRVQAALMERERHLYLALQAARMVAWTWDAVQDRTETTGNVAEIYGLSVVEYAAQGFGLLHPDDLARHQATVTQAASARTSYHSEYRVIRPDNSQTIWLEERAVPIVDAAGHLQKLAGVVVDITERKRTEEALHDAHVQLEERVRERTAELERSNRELNQFAYVASHDLKAPLRAIEHLANWIREDTANLLPPRSAEHLAKMQGRVKRMEKLLDDLLAYSRAGRVRPAAETVEIDPLVQDVMAVLAPPPGIVVSVEPPTPRLSTPRASLELVLRNLIGNAIKHHHREHGRIRICATAQGELVEFTVSDDGPGIEAQYHARIFDMFQTLQPRDQIEGSGMGLAIVKKLVESYGGTITVESALGQGSTFRFTWPRWVDTPSEAS